jgi:hypothetical protein
LLKFLQRRSDDVGLRDEGAVSRAAAYRAELKNVKRLA